MMRALAMTRSCAAAPAVVASSSAMLKSGLFMVTSPGFGKTLERDHAPALHETSPNLHKHPFLTGRSFSLRIGRILGGRAGGNMVRLLFGDRHRGSSADGASVRGDLG